MKAILLDDLSMVTIETNGDFESYSVDEFAEMYGEDCLEIAEDKAPDQPDIDSFLEYWQIAITLVNTWAKYQAKRKLFANATCSETCHTVQSVIDRCYRGNVDNLEKHVKSLYHEVEKFLGIFMYYCRLHKVEPIGIIWLNGHLVQNRDYKKIRENCKRKMDLGKEPCSLCEFIR